MSAVAKLMRIVRKFGLAYTFFYALKKLGVIREIPVSLLVERQNYYKNLPPEEQKRELAAFYKNAIGTELHLDNPRKFTEKIQWFKLNDSTKEKADLADKYLAPRIIAEKFGGRIKIIPQLGVWSRAEDIDFDSLPDKFALKCTHGSLMNIIVKDKSRLNIKKTRKRLNDWLKVDYGYVNGMFEKHYSYIEPRIIAEQYIEEADGNLHDYKFHCFMGEPKFIEYIGDSVPEKHIWYDSIYTADWELTDIHTRYEIPYDRDFPRPERLDDMRALARDMAKPFSYVRVDFYCINGEIYFGELTFTPDSGFIRFTKDGVDEAWGDMIVLPEPVAEGS